MITKGKDNASRAEKRVFSMTRVGEGRRPIMSGSSEPYLGQREKATLSVPDRPVGRGKGACSL